MAAAEDLDGIAEIVEANAVISQAQAKLGRLDSLQSFDVAFLRFQKAGNRSQDLDGEWAAEGSGCRLLPDR
jgi:hypothetical protein